MNFHLLCYVFASLVGVAVLGCSRSAGANGPTRAMVAFIGVMILCWSGVGVAYNVSFISSHIPIGLYTRINAVKCLCLGAAAGTWLTLVVTKQVRWFLWAPAKKG